MFLTLYSSCKKELGQGYILKGHYSKTTYIASAKALRWELVWGQVGLVETTQEKAPGDETGGEVEATIIRISALVSVNTHCYVTNSSKI